jgi:hypothetical protein
LFPLNQCETSALSNEISALPDFTPKGWNTLAQGRDRRERTLGAGDEKAVDHPEGVAHSLAGRVRSQMGHRQSESMTKSSTKIALFVKLFLATGIPFGASLILIGLAAGALAGVDITAQAVMIGIAGGIEAGVLFSAMLGVPQISNSPDPRVRHTREIVIERDFDYVRYLCLRGIQSLEADTLLDNGESSGVIVAHKEKGWKADVIQCEITTLAPHQQHLKIRAFPRAWYCLVDLGSNYRNAVGLTEFVTKAWRLDQPEDGDSQAVTSSVSDQPIDVGIPLDRPDRPN